MDTNEDAQRIYCGNKMNSEKMSEKKAIQEDEEAKSEDGNIRNILQKNLDEQKEDGINNDHKNV